MHYGPVSEAVEVSLDEIVRDERCQQWPQLDESVVERYRELMGEGVEFEPVRAVVTEDGEHILYDGFKRVAAAERLGWEVIDVIDEPGTLRDAILRSTAANAVHGQPRSTEAIRKAIYTLLDDPEWSTMSQREMARQVGVSHTTVQRAVARYQEERGLVPKPKPKGNPTPSAGTPVPRTESDRLPDEDDGGNALEGELPGDDWEESGEDEAPQQKAAREYDEAMQRSEGVLSQLSPESAELFRDELAFAEAIKSTVKLLKDQYRQHGGRKRRGPFSARVRWLAECPGLEQALVCLVCDGAGMKGAERCPSCKGHGFALGG